MIDHRFQRHKSVQPATRVAEAQRGFVGAVEQPDVFCRQRARVDEQIKFTGIKHGIRKAQRKVSAGEIGDVRHVAQTRSQRGVVDGLFRTPVLQTGLRFFDDFFYRVQREVARKLREATRAMRLNDDVGVDQNDLVVGEHEPRALKIERNREFVLAKQSCEIV